MVPARAEHIPAVAAGMREADREEAWAWARMTPEEALMSSLDVSPLAWTGLLDGEPITMFGACAASLLAGEASPWLLGTDRIDEIPATFARMSRRALGNMLAVYPVLANWSDARHTQAHHWLAWLGFRFGAARPMGALGMPFVPFAMRMET